MIILNMQKKNEMTRLNIGAFDIENNILTLLIDVGEYDATNKTITAIFEGKPETAPLVTEGSIIKLPITSDLVEPGINKIQLNFRWGANKIEQSPVIWWTINKSLLPEGIAQESIDIISYLISEVNRVVGETGDIKEALDSSITNANTSKTNLLSTIDTANTTKGTLEGTIGVANTSNGALISTIGNAGTSKTNLEGTIGLAGTAQTNLNNKIGEATTSKEVLDQAIIDNQIVTLPVFNAHKEDYANQINLKMKNIITNGNFENGITGWSSGSGVLSVVDGVGQNIGNGSSISHTIMQATDGFTVVGKKYYYMSKVRIVNGVPSSIRFSIGGVLAINGVVVQNVWTPKSGIITATNAANQFYIYANYVDATTQNGKVLQMDEFLVVDLTSCFGAGNEPTIQEMDILINLLGGWFDGEITLTQKQLANWHLKMIRQNRNAIVALGGTIV